MYLFMLENMNNRNCLCTPRLLFAAKYFLFMANITEEAKDTKSPSKYLIMTDENTSWMMPVSRATCRHILLSYIFTARNEVAAR